MLLYLHVMGQSLINFDTVFKFVSKSSCKNIFCLHSLFWRRNTDSILSPIDLNWLFT